MATDDTIARRYIAHGLALVRAANGMIADVDAKMVKLAGDIRSLLSRSSLSGMRRRELNALLSDFEDAIYQRYTDIIDAQNESLPDLIAIESEFAQKAGDYNNRPSENQLAGVFSGLLIFGASLKDLWRKQAADLVYRTAAAIKAAQRGTEPDRAAVSAILGQTRGAQAGTGGDIGNARRAAAAITQSGVQAASQDARLATFKANGVKFFEWHAILDPKVCPVCAIRSGKLYTIDGEPVGHDVPFIPLPAHPWDRCLLLPHNGEPPADGGQNLTQFTDYLKTLSAEQEDALLGKGRAELFRRGVINLNDLISQNGQLLSLAELRAGLQ